MAKEPVAFRPEDAASVHPVILLFAPSERSPAYENQMALLAKDETIRKLDAVLVQAFARGTNYVREDQLDPGSADMLRTAYRVDENDFLLVLLGRDGSEKYRSDAPIQPSVVLERLTDATRKDPW